MARATDGKPTVKEANAKALKQSETEQERERRLATQPGAKHNHGPVSVQPIDRSMYFIYLISPG